MDEITGGGGSGVQAPASRALQPGQKPVMPQVQDYLDLAGVMIVALDTHYRVILVNRKACEVLGLPEREILGRLWFSCFIPERRRREVQRVFNRLMKGEVELAEHFENEVLAASGQERIISWHNTLIRDSAGRIAGTLSSGLDITGQRLAEQTRQAALERMESIFRASPAGIGLVVDRVLRQVNERLCAMLGYEPKELLDRSARILYPDEETYQHVGEHKYAQIRERGTGTVETRWQRKDGLIIDVLLSSSALDHADLSRGVTFTALDITEQRAARLKEQQHARHLAFLAQTAMELLELPEEGDLTGLIAERLWEMTGGQAIVGVEELEDGHWISPAALRGIGDDLPPLLRILGRPPEELPGHFGASAMTALASGRLVQLPGGLATLFDGFLAPEQSREIVRELDLGEIFLMGLVRHGQICGAVVLILRRGAPAPDRPLVEAFVVQAAVALERRRSQRRLQETERQLLQSQKLEAVGHLAGGMAHDFNNMLSVMLMHNELMLRELGSGHPLREDLEQCQEAVIRAASLTGRLLAFSSQQAAAPVALDLNEVVAGIFKMLRRLLGEEFELLARLEPELHPTRADPGQLEQVLVNMVLNAQDALPGGGQITIETANVVLQGHDSSAAGLEPGSYAMLAVADTGCGMDEETAHRIFEPFFTTKETGKGTGLGLSTVYGIVRQSGGGIVVRSQKERGTVFRIYFPVLEAAPGPSRLQVPAALPARGQGTILVAEDDEMLRRIMVRVLRSFGYEVLQAGNGIEALQVAAEHEGAIDLLISDLVMPRMGGRRLAKELARQRLGLRVLFTSGYEPGRRSGMDPLPAGQHFLPKPFLAHELLYRVCAALDPGRKTV